MPMGARLQMAYKNLILFLAILFPFFAEAAPKPVQTLPLWSAGATNSGDALLFVNTSQANLTHRLYLWDLVNLPPFSSSNYVLGKPLTGFSPNPGTVAATDTLIQALNKIVGNQNNLSGGNLTESTSSVLTITGGTGAVLGSGTSIQVKKASGSQDGFLGATDFATFAAKQNALTLGDLTPGTGLSVSGGSGAVVGAGTTVGIASGFYLPTTADQTAWNAKESALTFSAPLSRSTNTISIPAATNSVDGYLTAADRTAFAAKQPAGNYVTGGTGEATFAGPGDAAVTLTNSAVIGKVLTGYTSGAGTITASDSILTAIQKLNGNVAAAGGAAVTSLTGEATGTGPGATAVTLANSAVIGKVLTGFTSGAGTVGPTDTILSAVQKLDGNTAANTTALAGKQPTGDYVTGGTGDVQFTGPGSVPATIQPNAVTGPKIAAGAVDLTTKVTNTLPIANGGTNGTTKQAAFDNLSPTAAKGSIPVHNGTNNVAQVAGANGQALVYDSAAASGVRARGIDDAKTLENVGVGASFLGNAMKAFITGASGNTSNLSNGNFIRVSFRKSTEADGAYNVRTSAASTGVFVEVPTGATLGLGNTGTVYVYAVDTGTTIDAAVSGSNSWNEDQLQNVSAIDSSSNSASLLYSGTAYTGAAIRYVGYIKFSQTTAGVWTGSASTVAKVTTQRFTPAAIINNGAQWVGRVSVTGCTGTVANGSFVDLSVSGTCVYTVDSDSAGIFSASNNRIGFNLTGEAGIYFITASGSFGHEAANTNSSYFKFYDGSQYSLEEPRAFINLNTSWRGMQPIGVLKYIGQGPVNAPIRIVGRNPNLGYVDAPVVFNVFRYPIQKKPSGYDRYQRP